MDWYASRFYDPYLNHFVQPDPIIPNINSPQSWDKYTYVDNNPIRYNDPSGHKLCDDSGKYCSANLTQPLFLADVSTPAELKTALWGSFTWTTSPGYDGLPLSVDFSNRELAGLYKTGSDIQKYAYSVAGENVNQWMSKYLGGANFTHGSLLGNNFELNGTIYLTSDKWLGDPRGSEFIPTHELGHLWDDRSGTESAHASLYGGGVADQLAYHLGGNPTGLRTSNGTNGMPQLRYYTYGNKASAEYFADVFADDIYHPNYVPGWSSQGNISEITLWMNGLMNYEVSH